MKTIRPNKKSRNYYKAMSEKNRSMLLSYKDARELEYAYDEIDHALNKVMVKIWRNTGRVYELWAHTARFPRFREEENKEERFSYLHPDHNEFVFSVQLTPRESVMEVQDFSKPVVDDYSEEDLAKLSAAELEALKGM